MSVTILMIKMLGFILLMVKTDIILIKTGVVSYGVQDNVICSNNKINEDSIEKNFIRREY